MTQNYPRLSIEEFGKHLIESGDLDPVYIALHTMMQAEVVGHDKLGRWLLAYSCLYHVGTACYLSEQEGDKFFKTLMRAAANDHPSPLHERWQRGHERRHWRGAQAEASCQALWKRYGSRPQDFLPYVSWKGEGPHSVEGGPKLTFREVSDRVREHRGFGGWIAFKMADMIDRLGICPVEFNYADVTIYRDPVMAAERLVRQRHGYTDAVTVKPEAVKAVFDYLQEYFSDYTAPPLHDRPIGLPEVESVCCKWKSHQNGHYPLYNDITEIRAGLTPWAQVSETASFFLASMPKLPVKEAA